MTPTASKLALLELCAYWAQPSVTAPPLAPSRYAIVGTALHALVEGVAADTALAPLTDAERDTVTDWFAAWQRSEWAAVQWQHEVAFAYNVAAGTARVLGRGRDQYAQALAGEFCGTADLVYVDQDADVVWVPDIKTGFQSGLEPVAENKQLRFLGLAAARAFGVSTARIVILHLDAGLEASEHTLDGIELAAVAHELSTRLSQIPGSEPCPGAHCAGKWCPAVTVCPTQTALVKRAMPVEHALAPPETPEHALWLRDGAKALRTVADQMEAWARGYADKTGGVREPDGRVWARKTIEVERIVFDGPGAAEARDTLARLGLSDVVEVKATATKKAIETAVAERTGLKGKALAEEVERVLVPLRVAGVVKVHPQERWDVRKARGEG